jgi:nucleoside-diphosphate-sugar epimerase
MNWENELKCMSSPFPFSTEKTTWGNFLKDDLKEATLFSLDSLAKLSKANVLIVGAGGFVGSWTTAVLLFAREQYNFDYDLTIAFRNREKISKILDLGKIRNLKIIEGDLDQNAEQVSRRTIAYTHVIHAANPPSINFKSEQTEEILMGTSNLLKALTLGSKPNFIHLSSGAVYGRDARSRKHQPEFSNHAEIDLKNWEYGLCKSKIEKMVVRATKTGSLNGSNPRLFSFLGPHLPTDGTFAIGEFIKAANEGKEIQLFGNPKTTRSYMYPTDLVSWLLAVLVSPNLKTIHIGSEAQIEMFQLAEIVNKVFRGNGVSTFPSEEPPNHYVPRTIQTRNQYGFHENISLEMGLQRWKTWINSN